MKRLLLTLLFAVLTAAAYWIWTTPEQLTIRLRSPLPQPAIVDNRVSLMTPGYRLTAPLITYRDELFAYLMYDYLRNRPALKRVKLLLAFDPKQPDARYRLVMLGGQDLTDAIGDVTAVQMVGAGSAATWILAPRAEVEMMELQTRLFVSAYNLPVRRKLEELPKTALSSYLRRFIQFKSRTDPRIRLKLEPVPKPLSPGDAQQLAGDIIAVANFYSLPLEFFLGIGAMENNYMDVRGDLQHSIWKRRAARDDVVLERRRGRVRVLNDSAGVWQITRETLRYAHSLVQRDHRDYCQLPEHLRPPDQLNLNEVSPQVLTTYAGALLRDLLDRFDGDVTLAVSAYNGGPARPNLHYGAGVERVAAHARRVVEQAAVLNGERVVEKSWLRRP